MDGAFCLGRMEPEMSGRVLALHCAPALSRRLSDMGVFPGTVIRCLAQSPWGDLTVCLIRGAVVALRRRDCENILMGGAEDEI